jgi:hypothetical protein
VHRYRFDGNFGQWDPAELEAEPALARRDYDEAWSVVAGRNTPSRAPLSCVTRDAQLRGSGRATPGAGSPSA